MLKNAPGLKDHPLFLVALLLACIVVFASCSGDSSSNSSPTLPASNTQASAITPIGALATCLTIHSPSLVKLADGNYELVDEIDNCSGKDAGPVQITTQINTPTVKQSTNLLGPVTIPAHGKATYHTFTEQAARSSKELHFPSPSSSSAFVTVSLTINGAIQGEWDGQVLIPA